MTWFEATTTLRWVEKWVTIRKEGLLTEERRKVLQQWWVRMDQNVIVASNYADGEWRDVPTETDE